MVNRTMTATHALRVARKVARTQGYRIEPVTDHHGRARGKGSHETYALCDSTGNELARFGLTSHGSRDVSAKLLTRMEQTLAPWLGDNWTEKR